MKKTLLVLSLVFVLVAALTVGVFALGTNEAGVYEIASAEDLIAFRNMASFPNNGEKKAYTAVLTADIDMTGKEWTPFDRVIMNFDGQGHTISGITVTDTNATWERGLFANLIINGAGMHSTVKNVIFKDCTMNLTAGGGSLSAGIVTGYADRAAIYVLELKNCVINLDGTATDLLVGTIVGNALWGHNDFGTAAVGGKVDADCKITVAEGTTMSNPSFGGLVGGNTRDKLTLIRPEYKGTIEGVSDKGSFIGKASGGLLTILGYDIKEGVNTYDNLYVSASGGVKALPYVGTADELLEIIEIINLDRKYGFYLTADIDMTGKAWTPITQNWLGVIEGNGHTISGLTLAYENAEAGNYGLIANVLSNGENCNGTINNLTIANSSLTVMLKEGASGNTFVGGVAGLSDRGHVDGITLKNVDVAVIGNPNAEVGVGGAIGKMQWNSQVGAIAVYNTTTDMDCSVLLEAGDNGNAYAGGIVGRKANDNGYFKNCVNNAVVYSSYRAGGIAGAVWHSTNTFENCKNYGNIYGVRDVAPIVALADSCTVVCNNVVAGGFISGEGKVAADIAVYAGDATLAENATIKKVAIEVGATDNNEVLAYYQTKTASDGKVDIRLIFVADFEYLAENTDLAIKVEFTKDNAVVKTYNGALGNEVYRSVTADGDIYNGGDGIVLFGNIFTGVPTAEVNGLTITVTDAAGATV